MTLYTTPYLPSRPPRGTTKSRALQSVAYTISTSTCGVPRTLRPQLSPGLRPDALRATSQHLRQLSLLNQLFNLMYTFSLPLRTTTIRLTFLFEKLCDLFLLREHQCYFVLLLSLYRSPSYPYSYFC